MTQMPQQQRQQQQEFLQLHNQQEISSLSTPISYPHLSSNTARPEMRIDDVDAALHQRDVLIPPSPWSHRQPSSQVGSPLSPVDRQSHFSPQGADFAILNNQDTFTFNNTGHDVQLQLSAQPASVRSSHAPSPLSQDVSTSFLESATRLPPSPASYHGSVTNVHHRLRTQHPVFGNTSKLAQHYGIPTKLPPTPRVNVNNSNTLNNNFSVNRPPVPRFHEPSTPSEPSSSRSVQPTQEQSYPDFQALMSDYIKMLNNERISDVGATAQQSMGSNEPQVQDAAKSVAALFGMFNPSSDFESAVLTRLFTAGGAHDYTSPQWNDFSEYLTSPFIDDESPFDPPLSTPAQGLEFFDSPAVVDSTSPLFGGPSFSDMQLFDNASTFPSSLADANVNKNASSASSAPSSAQATTPAQPIPPTPVTPATHDFDALLQMSPETPALDPSSMHASPLIVDAASAHCNKMSDDAVSSVTGRRIKKIPNGTRRNIKATDLVPLEAPTQERRYIAPSTTSRKEVPAGFARKRARAAEDDYDELEDMESPTLGSLDGPEGIKPTMSEAEAIAAKRRQNTLAARRSRKRKLEYQQELETRLQEVERERDQWKDRALVLRGQIVQLGFPEPFRDE
jgi:hypothetical protein